MTLEQFAIKVMSKMGVYDAGNPLAAVDLQNVSDAYDAIYLTLLDEGLVTWVPGTEDAELDIPVRFSLPLIDLVVSHVKPFYAQTLTPADMAPILNHPGIHTIRRQLASNYVPDENGPEYF